MPMMYNLNYKEQNFHIVDRDYIKLQSCLPFWGLSLNKEQIKGAYSFEVIRCYGISNRHLSELNAYLKHTGIELISTNKANNADFIITYSNEQKFPIVIKSKGVSYGLKPITKTDIQDINKLIHKNVWLPTRTPPIYIHIHSNYLQASTEWLSFMIVSYLNPSLETLDLSHIPFSTFHYIIEEILTPINTFLASVYQSNHIEPNQWPIPPLDTWQGHRETEDHYTVEDKKMLMNNEPIRDNQGETNEDNSHSFLRPYENTQDTASHQINPFKSSGSDVKESIINPFKKGSGSGSSN